MARFRTPPVTVVQGDDAPDITVTLQQDSSGVPYNLTDKEAYVVLVEQGVADEYVAKFPAFIDDEAAGQVRISWVKDIGEMTSYLDDVDPDKKYNLQIFVRPTNLPPTFITIGAHYGWFAGDYYFTGLLQEGSPVYKHETEDLFLSRSTYDGNGLPDEWVWLITSLRAAPWAEVKDQDKSSLGVSDLAVFPIWNYRVVLDAGVASGYVTVPPIIDTILLEDSGTAGVNGVFTFNGTFENNRPEFSKPGAYNLFYDQDDDWNVGSGGGFYNAPGYEDYLPTKVGWSTWVGPTPPPTVSYGITFEPDPGYIIKPDGKEAVTEPLVQALSPLTLAEEPTDVEARGTQTVLTNIPIHVKRAYRLGSES